MGLNAQAGNMYPFVTHAWNPIRGCIHRCSYCYLKDIKGFSMQPRFIEKELECNLGRDRVIFVGSSGDMFGWWVKSEWIRKIISYCEKNFENQYLFQTKNPVRYQDFYFPSNFMLATTIESNRTNLLRKISNAPSPEARALALSKKKMNKKMVTIEPVIDFDLEEMLHLISLADPLVVTIGADINGHRLPEPSAKKVKDLIESLRQEKREVRVKENLKRIILYGR